MRSDRRWWHGAVGYEVYLRSFADGDGDGVGDLPGLRSRLDHLAWLGVDIVWVTPFYPSPMADHGYDVADYTGVDPTFGTLDDLDAVVEGAHARGMRLVIDLVPNHTSDQHPWFRSARSGRDAPHRDWYVWRDPAPDGGPPNNWVSHFGGPAWTYDESTGQYYMHLFLPEQPDLNWANPAVRDAFDHILRFWLDRGVDGFRIDVAHTLLEDPAFRDNPAAPAAPDAGPAAFSEFSSFEHLHDMDQPGVTGIFQRWNRVVAPYDALMLGEVYLLDPERLTRYVADQTGLHAAFCFPALRTGWDAAEIRGMLTRAVAAGAGALAWPLSSHDDPHAASRFGGGEPGRERTLAYLTLLAGLPGIPFLYQGDELGLPDGELDPDAVQDPAALRTGLPGRDGSRTPMPWEPDPPGWGFTTAAEPWLPMGRRQPADTVAVQRADPDSVLHRTRQLLEIRRELTDLRAAEPVAWCETSDALVAYRRGATVVAVNVSGDAGVLPLDGDTGWQQVFSSRSGAGSEPVTSKLELRPDEAVIVTRS